MKWIYLLFIIMWYLNIKAGPWSFRKGFYLLIKINGSPVKLRSIWRPLSISLHFHRCWCFLLRAVFFFRRVLLDTAFTTWRTIYGCHPWQSEDVFGWLQCFASWSQEPCHLRIGRCYYLFLRGYKRLFWGGFWSLHL